LQKCILQSLGGYKYNEPTVLTNWSKLIKNNF